MSEIGGKKREVREGPEKYVGLFKAKVVAINPTREELNKIFGKEDSENDKPIDYTGSKEDVRTAKIDFWFSVEGYDDLFIKNTIVLKEESRRDKTGTKIQLINQVGDTQWVQADEDEEYDETVLFESFKNFTKAINYKLPNGDVVDKWEKGVKVNETEILGPKNYRTAIVGESDLADFMKVWLERLDLRDPDTNILLDSSKLFSGNFMGLDLIDSGFDVPFVALAYVKVDEDDADKQYQRVYNKAFLPANFIKFIKNGNKFPNQFSIDKWNKFLKEVEGEYGPDGHYVLEPLKLYNPKDDFATSKETRPDVTPQNSKY